jgi:hypothetical protein
MRSLENSAMGFKLTGNVDEANNHPLRMSSISQQHKAILAHITYLKS